MDNFDKKVSITEAMDVSEHKSSCNSKESTCSTETLNLLHKFLGVQQRRAVAYARLKRGFGEYMESGGELAYQQLCSEITAEFSDCSKQVRHLRINLSQLLNSLYQVREIESQFMEPHFCRADLAQLLREVQVQEKEKLQMTATIQVLKKAGRPSERLVSHHDCQFKKPMQHQCVHLHEITESEGTEDAEADAEYDNALKEAIRAVQDAVTSINDNIEQVRYEIEALEHLS